MRHSGFRAQFITFLLAMMADNIEHVISYWRLYQKFRSPALEEDGCGETAFGTVLELPASSYSCRPRPVDNPLHGVTGDCDVLSTTDQIDDRDQTWLTTDQTSCGSPWSLPPFRRDDL